MKNFLYSNKNISILLIFLVSLSIISVSKENLTESNFTKIESGKEYDFTLNSDNKEEYLKFISVNSTTDTIINFSKGNNENIKIFLYLSIDSIQTKNGSYVDYNYTTNLSNINELIYKNEGVSQSNIPYYLIIQNSYSSIEHSDTIKIFNELDSFITVSSSNPSHTFTKFYSLGLIQLKIQLSANINYDIIMTSDSEIGITIKNSTSDESLLSTTTNSIRIKNVVENTEVFNIILTGNSYSSNTITIKYEDGSLYNLIEEEYKQFYYCNSNSNFNFQINIANYANGDYAILKLEFSDEFTCKLSSGSSCTIDDFYKDSNEYLLFITKETSDSSAFTIIPKGSKCTSFRIVEISQPETITLSSTETISLPEVKNDIPIFYKISFKELSKINYILYTNNTSDIYYSTSLKLHLKNIYSFTYEEDNINNLYLRIRGGQMRVETTTYEIKYVKEQIRHSKQFMYYMTDCSKPKYLLHSVSRKKDYNASYFTYEVLSGNFKIAYSTNVKESTLLPTDNDLLSNYIKLAFSSTSSFSGVEAIRIKCTNPGISKINFVYSYDEYGDTIYLKSEFKMVINGKTDNYKKVDINKIKSEFKVAIPYGPSVYFECLKTNGTNKNTTLTESNYDYAIWLMESQGNITIKFESEDLAVVYVHLEENLLFNLINTPSKIVTKNNVYIPIIKGNNYTNILIKLNNIHNSFSYKINHELYKSSANLVITNEYNDINNENGDTHTITLGSETSYEITIINYFGSTINDKYYYYISFDINVDSSYMLLYDYTDVKSHTLFKQNQFNLLSDKSIFTPDIASRTCKFEKESNLQKDLYIFYRVCGSIISNIYTKRFEKLIVNTAVLNSKYFLVKVENNYSTIITTFSKSNTEPYYGIEVNYEYSSDQISTEDVNKLNTLINNISFSSSDKMFKWNATSFATEYIIFIMSVTDERTKYINNDCFLLSLQNSNQDDINIYTVNTTQISFNKTGKYLVNVIAKNKLIRFTYNGQIFKIKDDKNITKIILIAVGVILGVLVIGLIIVGIIIYKKKHSIPIVKDNDVNVILKEGAAEEF